MITRAVASAFRATGLISGRNRLPSARGNRFRQTALFFCEQSPSAADRVSIQNTQFELAQLTNQRQTD
jgi:hypothetical protein